MITRSFTHYCNRTATAVSRTQGWSVSSPHPLSVADHPNANVATPPVSVFACFDTTIKPAIATQGLNTDRVVVAAADRSVIAGVQRP